jgi:hypothetical protein
VPVDWRHAVEAQAAGYGDGRERWLDEGGSEEGLGDVKVVIVIVRGR